MHGLSSIRFGITDAVDSVAISADGNRVVTGSDDNTAKIVHGMD